MRRQQQRLLLLLIWQLAEDCPSEENKKCWRQQISQPVKLMTWSNLIQLVIWKKRRANGWKQLLNLVSRQSVHLTKQCATQQQKTDTILRVSRSAWTSDRNTQKLLHFKINWKRHNHHHNHCSLNRSHWWSGHHCVVQEHKKEEWT